MAENLREPAQQAAESVKATATDAVQNVKDEGATAKDAGPGPGAGLQGHRAGEAVQQLTAELPAFPDRSTEWPTIVVPGTAGPTAR